LPVALAPDCEYDEKGCFSGSALELESGEHLLLYTGVSSEIGEDGVQHDYQTQCIALGDGIEYKKYANNPVLDKKSIPEGFSLLDFRDPKIWKKEDGKYACVVGNRSDDGSGAILQFESEDGFEWKFVRILDRCRNEYGKMWECPDYFTLNGKEVLIVSPQEMKAKEYDFHCGDGTMCIVGEYDEKEQCFRREYVQALDYGIDFYAPQTLETPDGRRVMIGWMQNWSTSSVVPEGAQWYGQMSIPRQLSWRNGKLIQKPIRELSLYRHNCLSYIDVAITKETTLQGIRGRIFDMTIEVKPDKMAIYSLFRMKLAMGNGYYTLLEYNSSTSMLKMDRTNSGCNRDVVHVRECKVRNRKGALNMRIIMDSYSIEVFVNDGEQVMSMTIYTEQNCNGISFESIGKSYISVKKHELIF